MLFLPSSCVREKTQLNNCNRKMCNNSRCIGNCISNATLVFTLPLDTVSERDAGLPEFNTHSLEKLTPGVVESMNLSM